MEETEAVARDAAAPEERAACLRWALAASLCATALVDVEETGGGLCGGNRRWQESSLWSGGN